MRPGTPVTIRDGSPDLDGARGTVVHVDGGEVTVRLRDRYEDEDGRPVREVTLQRLWVSKEEV